MNKDIIRMAREAGAIHIHKKPKEFAVVGNEAIERFAEIVRADAIAKERVDIAKHYEANLFVEHMGGSIADYVISRGNQ